MEYIDSKEFLELSESIPVIDVRSPGEYSDGHIPGAINVSLFNDEERNQIGTLYKKQGRFPSVRKGLEFVGPKMVKMIDQVKDLKPGGELLMHCWRGGMRSESMAWLFETVDLHCRVLRGGYKSYRRYIRENIIQEKEIIVLGGLTGSGKTLLLHEMIERGEPVVDLEGLASHKGSAFGGIGQDKQPSTEHFENNLFRVMSKIKEPYCWVEDESLQIGKIFIPKPFFEQMLQSALLFIEVPHEYRIQVLVSDYAGQANELLTEAILRVEQRLGKLATRQAVEALKEGNYSETARILLTYYDKTYQYGLNHKDEHLVSRLDLTNIPPDRYSVTIIKQKEILLGKIYPDIQ